MAYLHVEDFRRGQDTRKSAWAAPPGSLRSCRNAHITRGGEVEKRKAFALMATLPEGVFGLHVLRDEVFVFGSATAPAGLPATVQYQRLQSPTSAAMSAVLSTQNFDGRIYAVAEYDDGSVHHFFDGNRVTDWDAIASTVSDNEGVAALLASRVNASSEWSATSSGSTVTITGPAHGVEFSANGAVTGGHQSLDVTKTQFAVSDEIEIRATGRFTITGGAGSSDEIIDVRVDGVSILDSAVSWSQSNSHTASLVADSINNKSSTPNYNATTKPGGVVVVEAAAGVGASANGFVVEVTVAGELTVADVENLSGGQDAAIGQPQIVQAQVNGTFDSGSQFVLTLGIAELVERTFTVRAQSAGVGRSVLTFKDKLHATTRSLLYFTGFEGSPPQPDPTAWGESNLGAGFINMSTQDSGADNLTGLGVYQDRLAVFSRTNIQIWGIDPDPDKNRQIQTLPGIGTLAPRTIQSYGDGGQDVFFLAESGVRSLRARDSSTLANAEDVGSPIDDELVRYVDELDPDVRARAVSCVEPSSGRYWLAVGDRLYVYSHFPGSSIRAWSHYDLGEPIKELAAGTDRVYVRVGNKIMVHGGLSSGYTDGYEVEVWLPFMDMENPGSQKQLHSLDIGCEGEWGVLLHPDPTRPDYYEPLGLVNGSTFGLQPRFPALGNSSHFSLRFVHKGDGPAKLTSLIVHYSVGEAG